MDEVAATLIEQPLLHSTSIGVVYRGKEFIRHRGDMEASAIAWKLAAQSMVVLQDNPAREE